MVTKPQRNNLMKLLICALVITFAQSALAQSITWILPSDKTPTLLDVQSSTGEVKVRIINAKTNRPVRSMKQLGWTFENFKMGKVLASSKFTEVKLNVTDLIPGTHKVYIRYWSEAYGATSQQWYRFYARLDGEPLAYYGWDAKDSTVIAGLGSKFVTFNFTSVNFEVSSTFPILKSSKVQPNCFIERTCLLVLALIILTLTSPVDD